MGKNKQQGTKWESELVNQAHAYGFHQARRLAEGGMHDAGDVLVGGEARSYTVKPVSVLAWKRLVRKQDKQRRLPDGEPVVFVLDQDTFWSLMVGALPPVIIEAKATERLNVTRTLAKAKGKVDKWYERTIKKG